MAEDLIPLVGIAAGMSALAEKGKCPLCGATPTYPNPARGIRTCSKHEGVVVKDG